jgi:hypothetical protein
LVHGNGEKAIKDGVSPNAKAFLDTVNERSRASYLHNLAFWRLSE